MEQKLIGSVLVIGSLILAVWMNRPRFFTVRSDKDLTTVEYNAMRYLGIPTLWGFILAFIASALNQILWNGNSSFLLFVFRLSLGFFTICLGTNTLIHSLFILPSRKNKHMYLIGGIPALFIIFLGGMAIVSAYRWY